MRRPTVNAAEAKRRGDYAIAKAKCELWFMINRLHFEDKNPAESDYYYVRDLITRMLNDPDADKLVRKYACAPDAQDKKSITNARDWILKRNQSGRPPLRPKQGRREDANTLRDRGLADIMEGMRLLGWFKMSCGVSKPGRDRHSICSILATAWAELRSELEERPQELRAALTKPAFPPLQLADRKIEFGCLTPLLADLRIKSLLAELSYGLRKDAKGLSEEQLKKIYDKSRWKRAQS